MRCLFVTPFPPFPPVDGGRIRMLELVRGIAERHEVEILSLGTRREADADAARALRAQGLPVEILPAAPRGPAATARALATGASLYAARFRSRAFAGRLADRLAATRYDVVQCEFAYTGQFRLDVPRGGAAWVLDAHNVEHRLSGRLETLHDGGGRAYRAYARRESRARRREEAAICAAMDAVVTVSETDGRLLAEAVPGLDPYVVPNGVDVRRIVPGPGESGRPSGLFVGKLDYRPNLDGLRWFAGEILPRVRRAVPDFELTVVGSGDARPLGGMHEVPGVRVHGAVDDVLPHLHGAWLVPVPLRAGSGTRLKILEALAAGKPVLTTSVGAEGIDAVPGEHLIVADDAAAFAAGIVRLCEDAPLRRRLGEAGRSLVERRYDWSNAVERLEAVYQRVGGRPRVEAVAR